MKLRFVIVGSSKVGKTSLMQNLLEGSVLETDYSKNNYGTEADADNDDNYIMNLNNSPERRSAAKKNSSSSLNDLSHRLGNFTCGFVTKELTYKCKHYKITLIDSESQTTATDLENKYFTDINGFIMVFSYDDQSSFEVVKHINSSIIKKIGNKYIPRVLVGNKNDLTHEVDKDKIESASKRMFCPFVSTSVADNSNLDNVIIKMIQEVDKEANEEHPYDIRNLNVDLNTISLNAKFFRGIFNLLLYSILIISILLGSIEVYIIIDKHRISYLITLLLTSFLVLLVILLIKYSHIKESHKILKLQKWLIVVTILSLMLKLLFQEAIIKSLFYYALYGINIISCFVVAWLSSSLFPLYLNTNN